MIGILEIVVLLCTAFLGMLWGIMFQKVQDEKMIKMLEVRLTHNRVVIENLTKTLKEKNK